MSAIWQALSEPWQDAFMRRAIAEVALLSVAGGAVGCWILLHRLAYSAESLAHGLLPGLVLAALTGIPLVVGGAVGVLAAAVAVAFATRAPGIDNDTAVAVVVTTLFAGGVLFALSPATPAGLHGLLFGDPLAASNADLVIAAGLVLVVGLVLRLLHTRLTIVGFDRAGAAALGVRAGHVDTLLLALLALALLVAVQGLGNMLVVAVLIAPAAVARRASRRLPAMMTVSIGVAVLASLGGLYVSYYADVAAGAAIAAVLVTMHLLSLAVPRRA